MRIALLADPLDLQYAGIHIYCRELIRAINQLDKKNEYFIVRPKASNEFDNMEEIVIPVKGFPLHQRIRQFSTIPKALKKRNVDLAVELAHFGPFNLPDHIKKMTVIHDLTPILHPEFHNALSYWSHRLLLPGILKRADHILAVSEHTSKDIATHYPYTKNKVTAIHLGKDESFIPKEDPQVLKKYGIQEPYILTVGTLEPRKNLLVLLKAYELFRQSEGADYQLVFSGKEGWKSEALMNAIEQSPFRKDIILTGYTEKEDLPILYTMAKVFVYPSLYEGFGLPVLEAMSCGAPTVLSNSSSLPEVGGEAALYFDPSSEQQLCDRLTALCNNEILRQTHVDLSLLQSKKFSWEETARQTITLFDQVVQNT